MPRRPRSDLPDGVYHVTVRGVARSAVFLDDDDRRFFLRQLGLAVRRHRWRCHAFCLMDNHYHVIVETHRPDLSTGLHRLNGLYSQRFNRRYERWGHLFGDRFAAWVIETDAHLREATDYVLQNPVRAGLCESAADWRWSGTPPARRTHVRRLH